MQIDEMEDLQEEEVIIHCRSGNRSGQACLFWIQWALRILRILLVVCWSGKLSLGGKLVWCQPYWEKLKLGNLQLLFPISQLYFHLISEADV